MTGLDVGDAALMSQNLWIKERLSKFGKALFCTLLRPSFERNVILKCGFLTKELSDPRTYWTI